VYRPSRWPSSDFAEPFERAAKLGQTSQCDRRTLPTAGRQLGAGPTTRRADAASADLVLESSSSGCCRSTFNRSLAQGRKGVDESLGVLEPVGLVLEESLAARIRHGDDEGPAE
jgi:hypothetical protein